MLTNCAFMKTKYVIQFQIKTRVLVFSGSWMEKVETVVDNKQAPKLQKAKKNAKKNAKNKAKNKAKKGD